MAIPLDEGGYLLPKTLIAQAPIPGSHAATKKICVSVHKLTECRTIKKTTDVRLRISLGVGTTQNIGSLFQMRAAKYRRALVENVLGELPPNLKLGKRVLKKARKKFIKLARRNFADYRLRG
jgi:hypothetical protein